MKFRNFGKKSLTELDELVANKNLTFGMDLSKYKLEVYEDVFYEKPEIIFEKLENIENNIFKALKELKELI